MAEVIKKKALLDDLKAIKETLVGQGDPILASVLNRAIACVEKQPVLDAVEVVHGRWIGGYSGTQYIVPKCSRCGYGNGAVGAANYCPNCGAKMGGDGDG